MTEINDIDPSIKQVKKVQNDIDNSVEQLLKLVKDSETRKMVREHHEALRQEIANFIGSEILGDNPARAKRVSSRVPI